MVLLLFALWKSSCPLCAPYRIRTKGRNSPHTSIRWTTDFRLLSQGFARDRAHKRRPLLQRAR